MYELRRGEVSSLEESRTAYNRLYRARRLRQRDSFYLWILSLLDGKRGGKLLDVSCGEGTLVKFAVRAGLRAYGLDLADAAVARAREETGSHAILIADGEALPFDDEYFDYVTNLGSLEHYLDPEEGVREISRVLKKDGLACILLPNLFGLLGNVKHVWETGNIFDDEQPIARYATKNEWSILLERNGLVPCRVLKYEREFPRTLSDLAWFLRHPSKILRLIAMFLIPLNLANNFVFLCVRVNGEH